MNLRLSKDSEITAYPLCLCYITKDFTDDSMNKKNGIHGWYVYNFSVDYNSIDVDISDLHKYLRKKHNKKSLIYWKKVPWIIWRIISLLSHKFVSLNNRPWQARSTLVNVNYNHFLYFPFISVNKCGGSCNTTVNPYAQCKSIECFAMGKLSKVFCSKWIVWLQMLIKLKCM